MSILDIFRRTFRLTKAPTSIENGREHSLSKNAHDKAPAVSSNLKRKSREESGSAEHKEQIITKRQRVSRDQFAPIADGEKYESTSISGPSGAYESLEDESDEEGRHLMPPPKLTPLNARNLNRLKKRETQTSLDFDAASMLSAGTRFTQQKTIDEFTDEYDMEKARRHAAATNLPINSGVWETGERELFFHLSYRGFEPLLPKNWMTDFRTLPLSLYPDDSDGAPKPLIQVYKANGEFRAIRELRELLDLGMNVRDKALASPGTRKEKIIEKATKKYIAWALNDAGIKTSNRRARQVELPIHVIVTQKDGQSTTSCLLETKERLHTLRVQHCRQRGIHPSIERDIDGPATPGSDEPTMIVDSSYDDLPVLYGILICKSVLAIFTLNSRTPSLRHMPIYLHAHKGYIPSPAYSEQNGMTDAQDDDGDDSASDPRFVADFNFSEPTKDVWNALVIAILAMQIRKDMLLLQRKEGIEDTIEDIRAGIEENSIVEFDEDDMDA